MKSQAAQEIMAIRILSNISRNEGKQIMKFD